MDDYRLSPEARAEIKRICSLPIFSESPTDQELVRILLAMRFERDRTLSADELELSALKPSAEKGGVKDHLPPAKSTWAEFKRICAHPLFSGSANRQALLRWLIERRYQGSDDFAGKVIAAELFKRDTAIARVEGSALRQKLDKYYKSDGKRNPICIRIPPQTFKPCIHRLLTPLEGPVFDLYKWIDYGFDQPSRANLERLSVTSRKLGLLEPDHPRVLAQRAFIHIQLALFGKDSKREIESAAYLIQDLGALSDSMHEVAFVQACVHASRFEWQDAEMKFRSAIETGGPFRPLAANPWHILFLLSRKQFDQAEALLSSPRSAHGPAAQAQLAFIQILRGKLDEAEYNIKDGKEWFGQEEYFLPISALLHGARGEYDQAYHLIKKAAEDSAASMISPISLGLASIFSSHIGKKERAEDLYCEMTDLRAAWNGYPSTKEAGLPLSALNVGIAAVGAGKLDDALAWFLVAAMNDHDPLVMILPVLPFLKSLEDHPPFQEFLSKVVKVPRDDQES